MNKTPNPPIDRVSYAGPDGNTESVYFRFAKGVAATSTRPDPDRLFYLELDANGRLVGAVSFEHVHALIIEYWDQLLTETNDGVPVGVTGGTYRYEVEFTEPKLAADPVNLDKRLCSV